ncbi:MAG: PQQ-binding-like beta-propeller repeat protein [Hyphomicrobiaceae bacterium]
MRNAARWSVRVGIVALAAMFVTGCSSDGGGPSLPSFASINPFAEKETPLPGKRVAVLTQQDSLTDNLEASTGSVAVPAALPNLEWSQPGGIASNAPGNLALEGSLRTVWSQDAGKGSNSSTKLSANPIMHQGRVYVLDAASTVSAFSASGGSRSWSTSLVPENEDDDEGFGGGIAADGGRVVATTGFGYAVALDASNGNKLWEKPLGAPARASPTIADGRVYAVTIEGRLYCLSVEDGTEIWSYRGIPQQASVINDVSPAIDGGVLVVTVPSGDVMAFRSDTGEPVWSDQLGQSGAGSSVAGLNDPSRPAIAGGVVYAIGHAGRMIATTADSGERLWSASIAGMKTPAIAGDAVYVVDANGKLVALNRESGEVRWATKLPGEGTWNGPVLAGGRLWATSSKGKLAGIDAATGRVTAERDLGGKVFLQPIVADGRMYVLRDDAELVALN